MLTGFAGGIEVKQWLLAHERSVAASHLERRCNVGWSCKPSALRGIERLARGRMLKQKQPCGLWMATLRTGGV